MCVVSGKPYAKSQARQITGGSRQGALCGIDRGIYREIDRDIYIYIHIHMYIDRGRCTPRARRPRDRYMHMHMDMYVQVHSSGA